MKPLSSVRQLSLKSPKGGGKSAGHVVIARAKRSPRPAKSPAIAKAANRTTIGWTEVETRPITLKKIPQQFPSSSSAPKAGCVKQPTVVADKLNIMWSNASLTPTNVSNRINALRKWLKGRLAASCPKNDVGMYDCTLDVSYNKMGEKAVGELIAVLVAAKVAIRILKLYHMDLGDGVAPFIVKLFKAHPHAPVRELHLSHNKLGRIGAQAIIAAAGNSGAYPYPRTRGSTKKMPLWLRLEHNPITRIENVFDAVSQRGVTICSNSPCYHNPTCMIAVPSFTEVTATATSTAATAVTVTSGLTSPALKKLPQSLIATGRGKGKGDKGSPPAKGKGKGAGHTPSPISGTPGAKGKKGRRVGGREGAPEDAETKRRGKEVYRLLSEMAQSKTLVQSWLPDWGRASPYQRMEWFGDKILGHLLTERVWSILDHTSEAFLTQFHQQATCNKTLAYIFDLCDIWEIMDTMNTTPKSRGPLRQFVQGSDKDVIKRRGDAVEVIFGDLTTQSVEFADTPEALNISTCLQLLTDMCVRCAEYFFEMEFSVRGKSSAPAVPKLLAPPKAPGALSKAALGGAIPKAQSKVGTPHSKASGTVRPRGMTITIAASPERYQQGDTVRPVVEKRVMIGALTYTECVLLTLHGWLHLPAVDPMIKKFDEWSPSLDIEYDFVLGRHELSLLALTPFALDINWTMRIDHRYNKSLVKARTMTDTTSKDAKATAMKVSKIDVTNKKEFPTSGVVVTIGSVKFLVVLDGCDFRDQNGSEMDLSMGPEDKETMRHWWTKTLFVPQVVGVITGPKDDKPSEVQRVEVYPQQELADTLDRKVSFGFMLDVLNAIKTIIGSKATASAIVDYVRGSGEVKVFEIATKPQHAPQATLVKQLHAKAVPTPSSTGGVGDYLEPEVDFDDELLLEGASEAEEEEELGFDGGGFEEHEAFLKKLQAISVELEFEDDTELAVQSDAPEAGFSEFEGGLSGVSDNDFDVEFDNDGGSDLAEGELDFDGDYESSYDGDADHAPVSLELHDELDLDEDLDVDLEEDLDVDLGDAEVADGDDLLIDGDVDEIELSDAEPVPVANPRACVQAGLLIAQATQREKEERLQQKRGIAETGANHRALASTAPAPVHAFSAPGGSHLSAQRVGRSTFAAMASPQSLQTGTLEQKRRKMALEHDIAGEAVGDNAETDAELELDGGTSEELELDTKSDFDLELAQQEAEVAIDLNDAEYVATVEGQDDEDNDLAFD